ncbi:hypothetical protein V8E36_008755 [Tilletia maclaganii]
MASSSAAAKASSASASASSTINSSSSSSKQPRPQLNADVLPTLLVGPPDPISNLRPVRYVSPLDPASSSSALSTGKRRSSAHSASSTGARAGTGQGAAAAATFQAHPYSLSEFTPSALPSVGPPTDSTNRPISRPSSETVEFSPYYKHLLQTLESASLSHRLRSARAQAFDQRFWADNNLRFARDQERALSSIPGSQEQEPQGQEAAAAAAAARFYSDWLSANSTRHRAYNRILVRRTFADLAPEPRWRLLVRWVRVVGWWERSVRAKVLRLLGGGGGTPARR